MSKFERPLAPQLRTFISGRIFGNPLGVSVMSEDARNSIYLWIGGFAFLGLVWASLYFDAFRGVSTHWFYPLVCAAILINLAKAAWGFWKRRASNLRNTDRS